MKWAVFPWVRNFSFSRMSLAHTSLIALQFVGLTWLKLSLCQATLRRWSTFGSSICRKQKSIAKHRRILGPEYIPIDFMEWRWSHDFFCATKWAPAWETFLWSTILMSNCLLFLIYWFSTFSSATFEHHLDGLHLLTVFGLHSRYWLKIIYTFWSTTISLEFLWLPTAFFELLLKY